jgi:hypothetical protein
LIFACYKQFVDDDAAAQEEIARLAKMKIKERSIELCGIFNEKQYLNKQIAIMLYGSVIGRKLKCLALAVAERANFNCN